MIPAGGASLTVPTIVGPCAARPAAAVRAAKAAVWAAVDLPLSAGLAREHDLARTITR